MLNKFKYNIPNTKSYNSVLINPNKWEDTPDEIIQAYNFKGEHAMNYITKVIDTNIDESLFGDVVSAEDIVLLTRVASRVGYLRPYKILSSTDKFANVHIMQVVGKFKDNIISYNNLEMLFDKVLIEPITIDKTNDSILLSKTESTSVGRVVKIGTYGFTNKWKKRDLEVKIDDIVLLRDNISTQIRLGGKNYLCVEENMIIGKFSDKSSIDIEVLLPFNNKVVLEEKQEEKALGSGILYNPLFNLEEEDVSEVYQSNRFKVICVHRSVANIEKNDTVIINRDCTNYVYLYGKKYYVVDGNKNIECKIKEGTN